MESMEMGVRNGGEGWVEVELKKTGRGIQQKAGKLELVV